MVNSEQKDWLLEASELVKQNGFCLVTNILSEGDCKRGISSLLGSYEKVVKLIGVDRLKRAGEEGVIRGPMSFDKFFFELLHNIKVQKISEILLSKTSVLHLQNGFIFPKNNLNRQLPEFQYRFHPDYPRYHNGYVASVNVLITLTDIKENDVIFYVVPGTHHFDGKLSQEHCIKNKFSISAKAGSALVFDSTCWHCGGANKSDGNWYGVNHQFTRSFLKQQIDYVRLLGEDVILKQEPRVQQMLGYYTRVVTSLDEYYQSPEERFYRGGQG